MKVNLKNSTGALVSAPVGFSWTSFFFGWLVPLFRGSFKWAVIQLIAAIVTCGISWIVFCFIFNKIWLKELLAKGLTPADDYSKTILMQKGLFVGK